MICFAHKIFKATSFHNSYNFVICSDEPAISVFYIDKIRHGIDHGYQQVFFFLYNLRLNLNLLLPFFQQLIYFVQLL